MTEITKEMIEKLENIVKREMYFDCTSDGKPAMIIPFSNTCEVFNSTPEILELALRELKIKAQCKKLVLEEEKHEVLQTKDPNQTPLVLKHEVLVGPIGLTVGRDITIEAYREPQIEKKWMVRGKTI